MEYTRLENLVYLLILRFWPIVMALDLVVTAIVARSITPLWADSIYDVMALSAAAANVTSFVYPMNYRIRASATGFTTMALAGRASMLMVTWDRPLQDRIVASVVYATLAIASVALGFASMRVTAYREVR